MTEENEGQLRPLDPDPFSVVSLILSVLAAGSGLYSTVIGRNQAIRDDARRANRMRIRRILRGLSTGCARCDRVLGQFREFFGNQLRQRPVELGTPLFLEDDTQARIYVETMQELTEAVAQIQINASEFVEEMYNSFDEMEWETSPLEDIQVIRNETNNLIHNLSDISYEDLLDKLSALISRLTQAVSDTENWLQDV